MTADRVQYLVRHYKNQCCNGMPCSVRMMDGLESPFIPQSPNNQVEVE